MSRTILDPQYANDLNGLFNGTTPIEVSTVEVGIPPNQVLLACQVNGVLTIGGSAKITGGDITLGLPGSDVVLSCNANDSLVVGGFVTATSGLTAQNGVLTLGVSTGSTTLTSNAGGSLVVGGTVTTTGGITAQNGVCVLGLDPDAVELTGTAGVLTVEGTCNAVAFRGGIIFHIIQGLNPGTLAPSSGYTFPSMEIPNFVGSASSAYLISCNNEAELPYLPVVFTITYASNDGTNTYVNIGVMNVSTTTSYGALFDVSIIAMN